MTILTKIKQYPLVGLVLLAYIAFISLGMPDGLLGVAWPSIRASFTLPLDAVGLLLIASVSGYTTSSFLNGPLISRLGVGRVLALSCAMTGLSLIGYTLAPQWWVMVLLGVFAGLGAGAIDAGLNTYVASHFGESLMQGLHASYGIGVTLGPVIMTAALTSLNSWRAGYRIVGGFQIALALGFALTIAMWSRVRSKTGDGETQVLTDYKTSMVSTLREPRAWGSALIFFLYVGGEVAVGTWTYSLLTESRGVAPATAGLVTGSYWAFFTIGRIAAGFLSRRTSIHAFVQGGLAGAMLGALLLAWNPAPWANLLAVALIGLSIAPIFPAMMSGTSQRVGARFAANTIGMQMAATGLGMATIPGLVGVIARRLSLEVAPYVLLAVFGLLLVVYLLVKKPRIDALEALPAD